MALYLGNNKIAGGGSGGSTVQISAIQTTGTNIANLSVDGVETKIYAPTQETGIKISDIYPVGSIYTTITNSDTCPFEGIDGMHWEKIGEGRCLFGADSTHLVSTEIEAGLPNISATANLSNLSTDVAGKHSHTIDAYNLATTQDSYIGRPGTGNTPKSFSTSQDGSHSHNISGTGTITVENQGVYGKSTTVQPPAIAVIFWERIS